MALSPADFAAYSRATGTPYPESPEERAQMVPEVRAFRQNQLQAPQQQESNSLALGLGIGLGLAGVGGGLMALRGRAKKAPKKDVAGKSGVKMTDLSNQQASELVEPSLLPEQTKAGVYERVKRKFPDVPGEQELTRAYAPEAQRAEAHAEKFGYADLNPAERKLTNLETGEIYSRGRSPDIPLDLLTRFNNELEELGLDKITRGEAGEMLAGPEVAAETRQMTGTESSRQSAAVRRMEKEEENLAKNILSELAQETLSQADSEKAARIARNQAKDRARASDYMSDVLESVISEAEFDNEKIPSNILKLAERAGTGTIDAEDVNTFKNWAQGQFKNDPTVLGEINENLSSFTSSPKVSTLTETYETFGEPAARVQNVDAVDTASDQIDSRFESTVQRDVDSVFEGKPAVAAEKLEVYGPLTAQETADQALAEMIQLRQDLYNQSTQPKTIRTKSGKLRIVPPNTVRAERALAERFKTGETTKLGELGVTGKSLEQVTLPSGPMRQTVQGVETSQSPTFFSRSVANIGEDPFSSIDKAASDTSIRGRSRVQNEPEQFRQRVDSSGRRIDDEFGVELTELDTDTGEPRYSRKVVDSVTGKLTPEFAPKGKRVVQLYQGEGQPTKSMYIPESDPGGIGIYGEERSFAAGPVSKFGENLGEYTKTAQRKPTDLPYPQKKGGDLTDMSTPQLETFASNAVKKNPRAAQAAMSELERREVSKRSMQASEAVRRANIEGRDPQMVLRSMGFGV